MRTLEVIDGIYTGNELTGAEAKRQHIEHSFKIAKDEFIVKDAGFAWYEILGVTGLADEDIKDIFRRHLQGLLVIEIETIVFLNLTLDRVNAKGSISYTVKTVDGEFIEGVTEI